MASLKSLRTVSPKVANVANYARDAQILEIGLDPYGLTLFGQRQIQSTMWVLLGQQHVDHANPTECCRSRNVKF